MEKIVRLAVALAFLAPAWVQLAHAGVTPANFLEGEHSIEALLHLPEDLPPGKYEVFCEALIRKDGRAGDFICYQLGGSAPADLVRSTAAAGRKARFKPAVRDGKPSDVYMMLMVHVYIAQGEPLVLAVPNNGVDAVRYASCTSRRNDSMSSTGRITTPTWPTGLSEMY